jgi:hypothetical protein
MNASAMSKTRVVRSLLTGSLAVLAAATAVVAPSAARDATSPRIVSAAMQDADGDARADRVRLTTGAELPARPESRSRSIREPTNPKGPV